MPNGGLAFWVGFTETLGLGRLADAARERRLFFQNPGAFDATGAAGYSLRLGFASLDADELRAATLRLAAALDAAS